MANDRKSDRPQQDQWQRDLTATLRRIGEQMALGIAHEAEVHATKFAQKAREKHASREILRAERHRDRAERRAAKARARWEAKYARTHAVEGYAFLAFAALLVVMAFLSPSLWWMVFVAIGFGLRGAQIIGFHRRKSLELSEGDAESDVVQEDDERADRINEVCDKLKAALKDAPASVRDFLSKPEETVESLRKTSLDLLKREVSLRVLISPSEVERLNRERTGLLARIEMESDDIIRQRLSGALAALENQQKQHTEVQRSADRLDAERTRLGYTLEGLYAQVMRVKTADAATSDGLSAGLRVSLDQLRDEMNALADAVEQVNRTSAARTFEAPETFESGSGERTGQKVR